MLTVHQMLNYCFQGTVTAKKAPLAFCCCWCCLCVHARETACAGLITPSDFVRITSTAAAHIFNIYPRKGVVAAGSDADVIVLDPSINHTISAATHHSRMDTNVYEGACVYVQAVCVCVLLSSVEHLWVPRMFDAVTCIHDRQAVLQWAL